MRTHEELIAKVKELISKDSTGKALDLLEKANLSEFEIHILNLSSRHSKLAKETSFNIIDNESAQRTLNKINVDLFELLSTIEESGISEVKDKPAVKKEEVSKVVQIKNQQNTSNNRVVQSTAGKTKFSNSASTKSNAKMYFIIGAGLLMLIIGAFWFFNNQAEVAAQKAKTEKERQIKAEAAKKEKETLALAAKNKKEELDREKKKIVLGNKYGGGIIFYIKEGGVEGLIAAQGDVLGNAIPWLEKGRTLEKAGAYDKGIFDGKSNTEKLVRKFGEGTYPAKLCHDLKNKYDDWYLPSQNELDELYDYSETTGSSLKGSFTHDYYWSSTEINIDNVYYRSFYNGKSLTKLGSRPNQGKIRAIRKFKIQ